MNRGHITNLPDGCGIEIPGVARKSGIKLSKIGALPMACAASARVQEMGVEAAVNGDVILLKQAMLHDPLSGAVCNPEAIWQLTDHLLVYQARWLPQYKSGVTASRRRLKAHVKNGPRVKLKKDWPGSARLKVKTVDEMSQNIAAARANASAADKGKMTLAKPLQQNRKGSGG